MGMSHTLSGPLAYPEQFLVCDLVTESTLYKNIRVGGVYVSGSLVATTFIPNLPSSSVIFDKAS